MKSAPVTLAWDPANDPSVKGYGIYYGLTNQPATNHVDAGTNLTVTLFDLLANQGYQVYAVSYNAAGLESVPSGPLLLTPSVLSRVRIARLATGAFRIALRAAPGSVCQVEYADTPSSGFWQVLGLFTADALGDVVVIDPAFPQRPSRFYRVARLATPPPFTRLQLAKQADGTMRINLAGSPGTTWAIQFTASLVNPQWQTLTIVTANAIGNGVVVDPDAAQHPARFYRAVLLVNPPASTRLQIAKQADGSMRISLNGSVGHTWNIQFTASLVDPQWQNLTMVTANATGNAVVVDPDAAQHPARFYRAVLLVNPPPFTRLQVARQSDGAMRITLNGSPGHTWNLQYAGSPVSTQWTTFATVIANATGEASATNLPPGNVVSRFYRAWRP